LPESYFDPATGIKPEFWTHYSEIATRDAQAQIKQTQALRRVEDVKVDLPKDFVVPQGVEFAWKHDAPELAKFKELAVQEGWSQDQASKALGIYASAKLAEQMQFDTALKAEREKLGSNGTNRVTAVQTFLAGHLGEDYSKALMAGLWTAKALEGLELLASKVTSQGAAPFSQQHRAPQEGGAQRVSDEEYNRMTQAQRWEYARSFDQKTFYDPNKMNGR
jgi:hypothetical protein